jgi:putative hemolysin
VTLILGPLFIAAMIGIVAFFAGVETGLFSVSRPKLENLAAKGDRRAVILTHLLEKPDEFIGTALVGINLAHVTLAVVTAWYFNTIFSNPTVSAAATTVIITPLILLFGEILPKTVCRLRPHATSLRSARVFRFVHRLFWPVTGFILGISRLLLPKGWQKAEIDVESRRDEILALLKEGEKSGVVEDDEKEMIQAALELGQKSIREVMVPRVAMAAIAQDMAHEAMVAFVLSEGYTRYPVYAATPDKIVGILHVADLLHEGRFDPSRLTRPFFLPEFTRVDDALEQLRREGGHIAVVVDEYGGTAGIVTIEDLLEELVGEIDDEFDDSHAKVIRVGDGRWSVDALADLGEVIEQLGLALDEAHIEAETVGGMMMERLGRIPRSGETVALGPYVFAVTAADDRRVNRVEIRSESAKRS